MGIIIFNNKIDIVYCNRLATIFLKRFHLPDEVAAISKRIFDANDTSMLKELFPGDIYVSKRLNGSPSNWTFKFFIYERASPLVIIFIIEETTSHKMDMNGLRRQFRLTRRETDVLRRVLDGLKNFEIAEDLEISEQTVKDHLSNIYTKLGVENRFALLSSLIHSEEYSG